MLSSIGANKTAKRAAIIHLMFNVIGTVIFAVVSIAYFQIMNQTLGQSIIKLTEISIFHTFFNVGNTLLLFPFAKLLVKISEKLIPGEDTLDNSASGIALRHLDERILETPSFAVENAVKEVIDMGNLTIENTRRASEAFLNKDMDMILEVKSIEKDIDMFEELITGYLIKINNSALTEKQQVVIAHLFNTVNDIERVADHAVNIAELAEYNINNDIQFSDKAID